jgi:hypothetical protein
MVLAVHSNASYLSKAKACSQSGGHSFCSNNSDDPPNNDAILNISQNIKAFMSSAAEAELGTFYINAHKTIPLQHLLEEMGHKQPPTPIQTNNSTALTVVTNNIQPHCTKAIDMGYNWIRNHKTQDQFKHYWRPGPTNCANYWTKHHCPAHHIKKHPEILTPLFILEALRASTKQAPAKVGKGLLQPSQARIITARAG